jgi:hypothetical protein
MLRFFFRTQHRVGKRRRSSMEDMFRSDCDRCASLCCVALAFDRSEDFAHDKPAGAACCHLSVHRCTIHRERVMRGYGGCVRYECSGAGQRVTMDVFGGRTWRDDPELLEPMMAAFGAMRDVHELLLLVRTARSLPMSDEQRIRRDELEAALDRSWTRESLASFEGGTLASEIRVFLASLRDAGTALRGKAFHRA